MTKTQAIVTRKSLVHVIFLLLASVSYGDFTTVVNNGASSNRVDAIFVGDGYTASEINTTYASDVANMVSYLFAGTQTPFPRYQNYFNVHRVNVISAQSGADIPQQNVFKNTALDATYRYDGVTDRLLYMSDTKANNAVSSALAGSGIDVDMRFGVVNESVYGGGGGQWAVYAGGNAFAREIAVHEMGHSYGRLADEYFSPGTYTGAEPTEANITKSPSTGKWDRWLGYNDPSTNIGPIGYYQGAGYNSEGLYRPSDNSKMRSLDRPFDAIAREAFINTIYNEVNPLDQFLATTTVLQLGDTAWVDTIDPSVIKVNWLIDGNLLSFHGESFFLDQLGLSIGDHTLTAVAYDTLLDHSFTGDNLDWWRLNRSALEQSVSWRLSITAVPEPSACILFALSAGVIGLYRKRFFA
jgi:hypothetical protein